MLSYAEVLWLGAILAVHCFGFGAFAVLVLVEDGLLPRWVRWLVPVWEVLIVIAIVTAIRDYRRFDGGGQQEWKKTPFNKSGQ